MGGFGPSDRWRPGCSNADPNPALPLVYVVCLKMGQLGRPGHEKIGGLICRIIAVDHNGVKQFPGYLGREFGPLGPIIDNSFKLAALLRRNVIGIGQDPRARVDRFGLFEGFWRALCAYSDAGQKDREIMD